MKEKIIGLIAFLELVFPAASFGDRDYTKSSQSYFPKDNQVFDNNYLLQMGHSEEQLWVGWCKGLGEKHQAALGVYPVWKQSWSGKSKYLFTKFSVATHLGEKQVAELYKQGDPMLGESPWPNAEKFWTRSRPLDIEDSPGKATQKKTGEWQWVVEHSKGETNFTLKSFATEESSFKLSRLYLTAIYEFEKKSEYSCVFVRKFDL